MNTEGAAEAAENEVESAPSLWVSAARVFVHNVEEAATFYEEIVGLTRKATEEDWVVFSAGSVDIIIEAVAKGDAHGRALIGRFLGVSLTSTDILTTFDVLSERGVEFVAPPAKQEWGGYLAHFYDPDRNIISLVS